MRMIRFGALGEERPGALFNGVRVDVSAYFQDYNEEFFSTGGVEKLGRVLELDGKNLPAISEAERLGPPVARPSKIVCVGLNYRGHIEETGAKVLEEPMLFMKASTAWSGPNDDIVMPRGCTKLDYEVELAVVIGRKAKYVTRQDALSYAAGFMVLNDVSERAFQKERGGQFTKGKSADTFCPCGPCLVTPDEIADPQKLELKLSVNGELRQSASTALMIYKTDYLISYISSFMTLNPGDVISTGTPEGVALGMKPPKFLQDGDKLEYSISNIGSLSQTVTREADSK